MRNALSRITALGFVVTASLAFPLTASADETLSGSCATTLQGARANGLVLDAGAPLNLPGKLTIALDSRAAARQDQAALSLPVGDTVRALGLGNSPQVRGLCTNAQNTVNAVGGTTQGVLGGAAAQPKPGKPAPVPHEPGKPEPKPSDPATETPSTELNPVVPIDGGGPGAVVIPGFFLNPYPLPADFSSAAPVIALSVPPSKAPSLSVDDYPVVVADRSGTAQALVTPQAPARLPLLLAVLAVSVVAAGLLRAWMYRKTS